MTLLAAVDVGTGSARAGVFDATGRLLGRAEAPLDLRRDGPRRAEQSSAQIWDAAGLALRAARAEAGVAPEAIAAVAFDATCSLVVRDAAGRPVGVTPGAPDAWDTILWLDHRALDEAEAIDAHRGQGPGGDLPEMALPSSSGSNAATPPPGPAPPASSTSPIFSPSPPPGPTPARSARPSANGAGPPDTAGLSTCSPPSA